MAKRTSADSSEVEKAYSEAIEYLKEIQNPKSETAIFERCVQKVS